MSTRVQLCDGFIETKFTKNQIQKLNNEKRKRKRKRKYSLYQVECFQEEWSNNPIETNHTHERNSDATDPTTQYAYCRKVKKRVRE
jgi:hypothetical protein